MAVSTVYVINLRGDADRWDAVQLAFAPLTSVRLVRIEAVYGSSLPHDVCVRLTNDPYSVIAKGAIGCLLSHVRAWEIIAAGDDPWVLVIEDDSRTAGLESLASLEMPAGLDFAFCNDRTQPELLPDAAAGDPTGGHYHALSECLTAIEQRKQAVGTDGYLVSREGARTLVGLFQQHGYFSHIDLRMLAYAVGADELTARLPADSWLRKDLGLIHRVVGGTKNVTAVVRSPPFTFHEAASETSRTREDRQGSVGGRPAG